MALKSLEHCTAAARRRRRKRDGRRGHIIIRLRTLGKIFSERLRVGRVAALTVLAPCSVGPVRVWPDLPAVQARSNGEETETFAGLTIRGYNLDAHT